VSYNEKRVMPEIPKSTKILVSTILISIIFPIFILGQADFSLPHSGLTPDSPFYFLDTLGEKVSLFFTFAPEKKAEKAIQFAEEKLAEVKAVAEKNKPEAIEKANQKYQEFLGLANQKTQEAKEKGRDVEELAILITEKTLKHQEILVEVSEKVPEQAKTALEKAIEASRKGSEVAVQAVTGAKKDELLKKIEEIRIEIEKVPLPAKEEIPPEEELPEEKPIEEKEPELIKPEATCQDECSQIGSKRCYNIGNYGYQTCGNYDSDDCLEWSSTTICPSDTITCQDGICIQRGQKGQKCSDGTLYNQCSVNKPFYCEAGNLINKCSTCGCPSGKQCQSNGSCTISPQVTCQNECSPIGSKRCSDNGYQVCGNYDTDECLEWSSITNCSPNTICQDGNCVVQQKCADGTSYSQCSTNKPKYCENGNLIDKCLICGCSLNYYCDESSGSCKVAERLDMLIFISPQYAADTQIQKAINEYINTVKNDVGWDTKIINITPEINDFIKIDKIIEDYYRKSGGRLKGAIMVGEDINTAVKAEAPGQESPSIAPWATNDDYTMIRVPETIVITDDTDKTSEALKGWKVLGELKRVDVVISLLYPPHNLDYQTRAQQIRSVFEKFSENRNKIHTKETVIFVDPELKSAKELHQTLLDLLGGHSEIYSKESPTKEEIEGTLNGEYMLYVTDGHGTPSAVQVSPPPNRSDFYAEYLSSLNTPLFLGGGCYTEGWWSSDYSCSDWWCSGQLDYSINENWFGAKIFTNPYLRVEVLGAPFQGGAESPQRNFIGMAISDLIQNKTLAESLKGDLLWNIDSSIIYGDLTFHYNF
jgi:chemotaxis protein histidine kinase CheA